MIRFSESLKNKFDSDAWIFIPTQPGGSFKAKVTTCGVEVDNLPGYPVIEWGAFDAVQSLLEISDAHSAIRGNAMGPKLGDLKLPIDSVEGCVAVYYGKVLGDTVFRRVSPVSNILVWAGLCKHSRGRLILLPA